MKNCTNVLSVLVVFLVFIPAQAQNTEPQLTVGNYMDITVPGGANSAYGVNNANEYVGDYRNGAAYGYLKVGKKVTTLDRNGYYTAPTGINSKGEIVGYYVNPDNTCSGFLEDAR